MKRFSLLGASLGAAIGMVALLVAANPGGVVSQKANADNIQAQPWIFVGNAGDCGTGYAAGSNIVTSGWLSGMGLPDNGGQNSNATDPTNNPNKQDPHRGLLLNKNGPTPDCSSAGASIKGVKGMTVSSTFTLGFDIRNGTHCGAGAPRFNVVIDPPSGPPVTFVGGCSNAAPTPAPQDPAEWSRVSFGIAQQFPTLPVGSRIRSIDIVYDEGTDTPTTQDPMGVGLAVIDNIFIDGQTIASGNVIAEPHGPRGDRHDKEHGDDDNNGNGNGHN